MKELEKVKKQFREMVAYVMDTKGDEVIANYTETFLEIYKNGVAKLESERIEAQQELQTLKDAVRALFEQWESQMTLPSAPTIEEMEKNGVIEYKIRHRLKELIKCHTTTLTKKQATPYLRAETKPRPRRMLF